MRSMFKPLAGLVLLATAGAIVVAMAASGNAAGTSGQGDPPARPAWVNADGTIDRSKLPEQIPVMGRDGKALTDRSGNPVTISKQDLTSLRKPAALPVGPLVPDAGKETNGIESRLLEDGDSRRFGP